MSHLTECCVLDVYITHVPRPHLVLGPDGFTPVALTTAVIDSPLGPGVKGFNGNQRDASYTLLQPVNVRQD